MKGERHYCQARLRTRTLVHPESGFPMTVTDYCTQSVGVASFEFAGQTWYYCPRDEHFERVLQRARQSVAAPIHATVVEPAQMWTVRPECMRDLR